jgi:hypothetical protein
MANQTDSQALEQARENGTAEAVRQLRAFTGIAGYTPDLNEPEHRAYLVYERELVHGLNVWTDHQRTRQATVDRLIERRNEAQRIMDGTQQQRQSERSDNFGARAIGALKDAVAQETRTYKALVKEVDEAWEIRYAADHRVHEIQTELEKVSSWLEQMFVDVEASHSERQAAAEAARLDREHAARDVSPRGATVFTPEEFVDLDPRRLLERRPGHLVLDGLPYGYRWRRDQDDSPRGEGSWTLVWNPTTHETFLERAGYEQTPQVWLLGTKITTERQAGKVFGSIETRMSERNSLAIVLDAYGAL